MSEIGPFVAALILAVLASAPAQFTLDIVYSVTGFFIGVGYAAHLYRGGRHRE